jgi:hypothetical protein
VRNRIIDETFYFTRLLAAGVIPGLDSYRVDKVEYAHNPKPGDYPVNDRVVEAFRNFVKADAQAALTVAQVDAELDYAKLRLRQEILTAAYGADNGVRVLLDSDPQVLRAVEALPDAKRLAESVRNSGAQG